MKDRNTKETAADTKTINPESKSLSPVSNSSAPETLRLTTENVATPSDVTIKTDNLRDQLDLSIDETDDEKFYDVPKHTTINNIDPFVQHKLDKYELAMGYSYESADEFFESIAQTLMDDSFIMRGNQHKYNCKKLRMICHDYLKNLPEDNWVKKAMVNNASSPAAEKDYQAYLRTIQFTQPQIDKQTAQAHSSGQATKGKPEIEGRILCSQLRIQIHVVDFSNNKITHKLINADQVKNIKEKQVDYNDKSILRIALYRNRCLPLLRPNSLLITHRGSLPKSTGDDDHQDESNFPRDYSSLSLHSVGTFPLTPASCDSFSFLGRDTIQKSFSTQSFGSYLSESNEEPDDLGNELKKSSSTPITIPGKNNKEYKRVSQPTSDNLNLEDDKKDNAVNNLLDDTSLEDIDAFESKLMDKDNDTSYQLIVYPGPNFIDKNESLCWEQFNFAKAAIEAENPGLLEILMGPRDFSMNREYIQNIHNDRLSWGRINHELKLVNEAKEILSNCLDNFNKIQENERNMTAYNKLFYSQSLELDPAATRKLEATRKLRSLQRQEKNKNDMTSQIALCEEELKKISISETLDSSTELAISDRLKFDEVMRKLRSLQRQQQNKNDMKNQIALCEEELKKISISETLNSSTELAISDRLKFDEVLETHKIARDRYREPHVDADYIQEMKKHSEELSEYSRSAPTQNRQFLSKKPICIIDDQYRDEIHSRIKQKLADKIVQLGQEFKEDLMKDVDRLRNRLRNLTSKQITERYVEPLFHIHTKLLKTFIDGYTHPHRNLFWHNFFKDGNRTKLEENFKLKLEKDSKRLESDRSVKEEQKKVLAQEFQKKQDKSLSEFRDKALSWLNNNSRGLPKTYRRDKKDDQLVKEITDRASVKNLVFHIDTDGSSLLHISMKKYSLALIQSKKNPDKKQSVLNFERIIDILQDHGCSPYWRNNAQQNAYKYANDSIVSHCISYLICTTEMAEKMAPKFHLPNWPLLKIGLRYASTYSPAITAIKEDMNKYTDATIEALSNIFTRIFINVMIKEINRCKDMGDLLESMYISQNEVLCDRIFIKTATELMKNPKTGLLGRTKIYKQIRSRINQITNGQLATLENSFLSEVTLQSINDSDTTKNEVKDEKTEPALDNEKSITADKKSEEANQKIKELEAKLAEQEQLREQQRQKDLAEFKQLQEQQRQKDLAEREQQRQKDLAEIKQLQMKFAEHEQQQQKMFALFQSLLNQTGTHMPSMSTLLPTNVNTTPYSQGPQTVSPSTIIVSSDGVARSATVEHKDIPPNTTITPQSVESVNVSTNVTRSNNAAISAMHSGNISGIFGNSLPLAATTTQQNTASNSLLSTTVALNNETTASQQTAIAKIS